MRTVILAIAAMLAGACGGVAHAQNNPPREIQIYNDKSGFTLATNPAPMSLSQTGLRSDPRKPQEEKLNAGAARAAAVQTRTPEERVRIEERMQATAAAAPKACTNAPPATRIAHSEKSDETRKAMLRQRLSELQAQRRWIEEQENSLRFAVVEIERNPR